MNRIALIVSIVEFLFGGLASMAAAYLLIVGEQMWKWIPLIVISVVFMYLGLEGMIDYFEKK